MVRRNRECPSTPSASEPTSTARQNFGHCAHSRMSKRLCSQSRQQTLARPTPTETQAPSKRSHSLAAFSLSPVWFGANIYCPTKSIRDFQVDSGIVSLHWVSYGLTIAEYTPPPNQAKEANVREKQGAYRKTAIGAGNCKFKAFSPSLENSYWGLQLLI